jgi:hypothetical protein
VLLAAVTIAVALPGVAVAGSHFISQDSVDDGEIRYEDQSGYDGAVDAGPHRWNPLGRVHIVRDGPCCSADLEYNDYYDSTSAPVAYYQGRAGADLINFNTYWMGAYGAEFRRAVGVHETGHALGLGDHETAQYSRIVMYYAVSDVEAPKEHDRSDYYKKIW